MPLFLHNNLEPPVYNCHKTALAEMEKLDVDGVVPCPHVNRHSTLSEALVYIEKKSGKQLENFDKVVAVVRHPYTLEYSFYNHLKKPHVRTRWRKFRPDSLELANGEFKEFVIHAGYHRENLSQEKFFLLGDKIPNRVELVRFETLAVDFPMAVAPYLRKGSIRPFPKLAATAV